MTLVPWLVAAMVTLSPPGRVPSRESEEAGRERYISIAEDIDAVVRASTPDVAEQRRRGALLVAIAVHESGLRVDVDAGATRGGGRDVCLLQLRGAGHEVETSRPACLREGLRRALSSIGACRKNEPRHQLAAYASGDCTRGFVEAAAIHAIWKRIVARPVSS